MQVFTCLSELAMPDPPWQQVVIMYGYCIMFAAALPLAPLLCFVVNVLTIGINGKKILFQIRRPEFAECKDLGKWRSIFDFLTFTAVVTNAAIIGITSDVMGTGRMPTTPAPESQGMGALELNLVNHVAQLHV